MGVRKVKDESDLVNLLSRSADVFIHFTPERRGRPPKLHRDHIESILILCKTLLEDIHRCLDHMLPDLKQVTELLRAFDYLNSIKRRYLNRIQYLEKMGQIPPEEER